MKISILLSLLMFCGSLAGAKDKEAVVIEVRKKVKLHDSERVYADYFIRGGRNLGLAKGVLVSVTRRVPVHDPFENASVGDFKVKVADLEIIHADQKKSIGRLIEIDRREARPMLTYDSVMIGDRLDLDSMRAKVSYKKAPQSVFRDFRRPEKQRSPSSKSQVPSTDGGMEKMDPMLTKPQG
ncbi:MAG: hypothetical protein AAF203_06025 [Pseudomonadota bacterium]